MLPSKALRPVLFAVFLSAAPLSVFAADPADLHRGYYSDAALHGDTIVFTSEGDLWAVGMHGGPARGLTTGAGTEDKAAISPDGKTVAFSADYEGPAEVYTMPDRRRHCPSAGRGTVAPRRRLDARRTAAVRTAALRHPARPQLVAHRRERRPRDGPARPGAGGALLARRPARCSSPAGSHIELDQALQGRDGREHLALRRQVSKPYLSRPTSPAPRTNPMFGTAGSTSSPIATAS